MLFDKMLETDGMSRPDKTGEQQSYIWRKGRGRLKSTVVVAFKLNPVDDDDGYFEHYVTV